MISQTASATDHYTDAECWRAHDRTYGESAATIVRDSQTAGVINDRRAVWSDRCIEYLGLGVNTDEAPTEFDVWSFGYTPSDSRIHRSQSATSASAACTALGGHFVRPTGDHNHNWQLCADQS